MSWIKDNKFVVGLGGGTLVGVALLVFIGLKGFNRYEEELEKFTLASEEVANFEKLALYPKTSNEDGKAKALAEYRRSAEALQTAFSRYLTESPPNITPQEFTSKLLAANNEIRKAFEDGGAIVPDPFFVGFEAYKTTLAPAKITGVLSYQLAGIKDVLMALAKAKPKALKNLHRPALPEEDGKKYDAQAGDVARTFPIEITFTGSETSARAFFNSLSSVENKMFVVRALRVTNDRKDSPRSSDAKFDNPAPAAAAGDAFSGGFVTIGDDADPAEKSDEPKAPVIDSSRILSQVLGNESVQVFMRLDILEFLPVKKLP